MVQAQAPETAGRIDPQRIRRDFPIFERTVNDKPLIYLDNAATTQRPRPVIDAVRHSYERQNANVHRAVHTLSYEASVAFENAHKKIARFVNANSWREIVFTRNATEGLNLVAFAWGMANLSEGDEIVITLMEHHSDIVPWQMLREQRGVKLTFVDVDEQGRLRMDEFKDALNENVKLVGMIQASNVLGTINPVKRMIEMARDVGATTVVDAAQAAPHVPIDVQDLGCDFLAVSGHKMLGPSGTGFLHGRKALLEEMPPFLRGGDMIATVTTEGSTWNELPWKFEAGTPDVGGGIGLGAAADYLLELGLDNVYAHEQELVEYALDKMLGIDGVTVYGPHDTEDRLAVISFNVDGVHPHDLASILDGEGIAVRSGHHCAQPLMTRLGMDNTARASFYVYNDRDEVDALVAGVKKGKQLFQV